ncbi:MAG: NTP transferase domain-containing protein [SAR324 cluster bacterium]|uniref:NTP transferase domain-containing protein n=1 Tax=SAR324 cluster bacterium TaxID=2024889 RepID=A0A7X9IL91_9DELT|nr:NTP transferase domain-containing protein [SAR324 cluster bacterium]
MKAMILAAGLGTRLKGITEHTPKCLVQAGGLTMIEHTIHALQSAGVSSIIINTSYLSEKVLDFFAKHKYENIEIVFSYEKELLGTGGGLLKASAFFWEVDSFIVHNADVYSTIDLKKVIKKHEDNRALATLVVMDRPTSRPLLFSDGKLVGWKIENEAVKYGLNIDPNVHPYAFSGIQVLSNEIFSFLAEEQTPFSIITSYLKASERGALVQAYLEKDAFWIDMGTPERLQELRDYLTY